MSAIVIVKTAVKQFPPIQRASQMSGSRIGAVTTASFSIFLAVTAGLYHHWKLGLVGSAFVPFVLVASWFQAKTVASHDYVERRGLEKGTKVWKSFLHGIWS